MFETTFFNILILVAFAIPGFIGRKIGKIHDVSSLVFVLSYVAQPFLIIASMQSATITPENTAKIGIMALVALLIHAVSLVVCLLAFGWDKSRIGKTYALVGTFGNCGFMGIPLIQGLMAAGHLDESSLVCTTAFIVIFNLLTWTVGCFIMTGEKKYVSVKNCLFNPPTLAALFVAIPLYFAGITLPDWALKGVSLLGNMSAPVSLFILGVRLADMSVKTLLTDSKAYLSTALKLVVVPLITMGLLLPVRHIIGDTVFKVMYISMAMPSASSVLMLAELYNVEGAPQAAGRVQAISTLLAVASVPVLMMLL